MTKRVYARNVGAARKGQHMTTPLRFISSFTGIGGFEVGFQRAGMEPVALIENDPNCQTMLRRHFPDTNLQGDIHDVSGTTLFHLPRAHVLGGGFPCQDTSIAAPHRRGLAGKRSGAFYEFTRLVDEYARLADDLDPRWLFIENPTGLFKSNGGRDMATVLRTLDDLGYGWAYRVVDPRRLPGRLAGPQRRSRIIVVGHRGGDPRPAGQVLGLLPASGEAAGPSGHRGPQSGPDTRPVAHGDDLIRVWRKSVNPRMALAKGYEGGYRESWVSDGTARTLTGFDGGLATRQTHLIAQDGRLRTLTLTEWERLQGFTDGWTEGVPDGARFTMLGNAMHVGMAEWLGHRLAAVHAALPQLEVVA